MSKARAVRGEVWSLRYAGRDLGRGLVVGTFDSFVLMWPVTSPSEPHCAPAFFLNDLVIWPDAETGISRNILHKRESVELDNLAAVHLAQSMSDASSRPLRMSARRTNDAILESLIEHWAEICYLD